MSAQHPSIEGLKSHSGVQSSASSTHSSSSGNHGHQSHYPQQSHPGLHHKAYHPDPEALYHDSGIDYNHVLMNRNASVAKLYEDALRYEDGSIISSAGALVTSSGKKTGRSPKDKRIVDEPSTTDDIWWGPVNTKLSEHAFLINHERAVDYLNTRERLYVFDGYAGWDPKY
ncbi:Protein kinase C-like 1, partial [Haplosporangium sp. Z 27]